VTNTKGAASAVDFTDAVPLSGEGGIMPFWIGSNRPASLQAAPRLSMVLARPDYLRTMGIALRRGRFFTSKDTVESPCVMVIDTAFAAKYFAGKDPIGQTLSAGFTPVGPCRIVGVADHVRQWGLDDPDTSIQAQAYFALYQDPDRWVPINFPDTTIMVRTTLDTAALMLSIKKAVYGTGGEQPVYDVRTMQEIASESMAPQRFPMILLGAFSVLALLLASVGIYDMISYSAAQRVHEIGIRMALGAERGDVQRMVLRQATNVALLGVAIGLAAALALTRLLGSLLFGVSAHDALTLGGITVLLILMALAACYIPARRATEVDPMVALRYE
jgi:predicted permease